METYRCAYRDPHSPLTPLTPVSDIALHKVLRDHSPSLIPAKKIILKDCPPPRKARSNLQVNAPAAAHEAQRPSPVRIVVTSDKAEPAPPPQPSYCRSKYLHNLKKILTSSSRYAPKSIDLAPVRTYKCSSGEVKQSRLACFRRPQSVSPIPINSQVLRILQDIGQERYADVFRREEIDFEVFRLLTKWDLVKLGIDERDIPSFVEAIHVVSHW